MLTKVKVFTPITNDDSRFATVKCPCHTQEKTDKIPKMMHKALNETVLSLEPESKQYFI